MQGIDSSTTTSDSKSQQPMDSIQLLKKLGILDESETSTPSIEWIEYQKERFGINMNSSLEQLNASLEEHSKLNIASNTETIAPYSDHETKKSSKTAKIAKTNSRQHLHYGSYDGELEDFHNEPLTPSPDDDTKYDSEIDIETETPTETETELPDPTTEETVDSSQLSYPSIEGFMKFLKSMHTNWLKKSGLSIDSKIKLLKNLKDNLMKKIGEIKEELPMLIIVLYFCIFWI